MQLQTFLCIIALSAAAAFNAQASPTTAQVRASIERTGAKEANRQSSWERATKAQALAQRTQARTEWNAYRANRAAVRDELQLWGKNKPLRLILKNREARGETSEITVGTPSMGGSWRLVINPRGARVVGRHEVLGNPQSFDYRATFSMFGWGVRVNMAHWEVSPTGIRQAVADFVAADGSSVTL